MTTDVKDGMRQLTGILRAQNKLRCPAWSTVDSFEEFIMYSVVFNKTRLELMYTYMYSTSMLNSEFFIIKNEVDMQRQVICSYWAVCFFFHFFGGLVLVSAGGLFLAAMFE